MEYGCPGGCVARCISDVAPFCALRLAPGVSLGITLHEVRGGLPRCALQCAGSSFNMITEWLAYTHKDITTFVPNDPGDCRCREASDPRAAHLQW
jgi:hypothetical protein